MLSQGNWLDQQARNQRIVQQRTALIPCDPKLIRKISNKIK